MLASQINPFMPLAVWYFLYKEQVLYYNCSHLSIKQDPMIDLSVFLVILNTL